MSYGEEFIDDDAERRFRETIRGEIDKRHFNEGNPAKRKNLSDKARLSHSERRLHFETLTALTGFCSAWARHIDDEQRFAEHKAAGKHSGDFYSRVEYCPEAFEAVCEYFTATSAPILSRWLASTEWPPYQRCGAQTLKQDSWRSVWNVEPILKRYTKACRNAEALEVAYCVGVEFNQLLQLAKELADDESRAPAVVRIVCQRDDSPPNECRWAREIVTRWRDSQ